MKQFSVETIQDFYTTYTVYADSPAEARDKLTLALNGEDREDILSSAYGTGVGDAEEIVSVEEWDQED